MLRIARDRDVPTIRFLCNEGGGAGESTLSDEEVSDELRRLASLGWVEQDQSGRWTTTPAGYGVVRDQNPWRFRVKQILDRGMERPLLVGTLDLGEGIEVGDRLRIEPDGATGHLLSLHQEHQGHPLAGYGLTVDLDVEVGDELVCSPS